MTDEEKAEFIDETTEKIYCWLENEKDQWNDSSCRMAVVDTCDDFKTELLRRLKNVMYNREIEKVKSEINEMMGETK